jgi:hypothetical protein
MNTHPSNATRDILKLLSPKYDLTAIPKTELVDIMELLFQEYNQCRHELSTATLDIWNCIKRVAEEIVRRK